jgi:hypothetical protein
MTFRSFLVLGTAVGLALFDSMAALSGESRPKASLTLNASPQVAFTPARIVLTGDLKNVTNLDADFYCPTIVWEWGDGTQSERSANCDPFEPGTSEVKLRYVQVHTFNTPGRFRVVLRLVKGSQVVLSGSTSLTIRPGGGLIY